MSLSNLWNNLGNTFGFGDPAKVPTAPGVDMSALSYGGDPNMAKNLYGQANSTASNILHTRADQVQGQQADYTNAQNALANASQNLGAGQQAANISQNHLMNRLQAEAYGYGGPSAAQLAMRAQSEDAMRQQLAMANTSGSPAAMIAAQNNNVNTQNSLTQQLGAQRAAEMAQARGQLGQVISQNQQSQQATAAQQAAMGQQQANMAQYNTGNIQAALLANQGANIQQNQVNNQGALGFYNTGVGALNNQAQLNEQGQALLQQQYATQGDIYKAQTSANSSGIGSLVGAAGAAMAMMSDRRVKRDIRSADKDVGETFRNLGADSYAYRDPSMGVGTHYGPMAQDFERTPAGRSVVAAMPNGYKGIDTGRLALLNASETANQRKELDSLKAYLTGRKVTSDERAKKDKKDAGKDVSDAFRSSSVAPSVAVPIAPADGFQVVELPNSAHSIGVGATPSADPAMAGLAVRTAAPMQTQIAAPQGIDWRSRLASAGGGIYNAMVPLMGQGMQTGLQRYTPYGGQ